MWLCIYIYILCMIVCVCTFYIIPTCIFLDGIAYVPGLHFKTLSLQLFFVIAFIGSKFTAGSFFLIYSYYNMRMSHTWSEETTMIFHPPTKGYLKKNNIFVFFLYFDFYIFNFCSSEILIDNLWLWVVTTIGIHKSITEIWTKLHL